MTVCIAQAQKPASQEVMGECVDKVDVSWKPGNSGEYTLHFLCDVKDPFLWS